MPSPSINTNINAVPLDYFLRGVEAVKPSSVATVTENKQGNENVPVAQEEPRGAGKLVAQLDVLLLKAAKASTQSLDGKTVKQTFQKLVNDGMLDRDTLKQLGKAADTAAKTLKALDKFTGQQLAAAFDKDGKFDATTKAGKAILAAMTAQQDLSDLFVRLGEKLDSISQNDDSTLPPGDSQTKGVSRELRNEVDEMRLLCDRRATEIIGLAYKMNDFAVHLAANGQNKDPNVVAILKAKVNELLPRQALAMHGTADALATVSKEVSEKLRPLAEKIDAFRRNPSVALKSQEYLELQSDIATMKSAITDIRKNGIEVGGGRLMVADDIMKALETEVAKAEEMFKTARKEVAHTVLTNYFNTVVNLFMEDAGYEFQKAHGDEKLVTMLNCRTDTLDAMDAFYKAALDPTKNEADFDKFRVDLQEKANALKQAADTARILPEATADDFNNITRRCRAIGAVLIDFVDTVYRLRGGDRFFTGAEAMGVFEGKISVSSVVEACARGLATADVDPANEDANIVSTRELGSGVVGTVYELTRTDGSHVVFKGETESRTGLHGLAAGIGKSYSLEQKSVNLNIATKDAAIAMGMGDIIVNYSVGTHKGVFGFFMEKAKGLTGKAFGAGDSSSAPDAGMSTKEIKRLPPAERQQIKADIMRELNRLQWLDLVTGQSDRHWQNYFIHVDRETHKVTVKGIDNDASYSQYRTGAVKFTFDKARSLTFMSLLKGIAKNIDSHNVDVEYQRLLKDPGVTTDENGNITVDASKLTNKAIGYAISQLTGVQSLAVPDKIDSATYKSLMALKQDPARKAYLDSIRPRLSKENYDAAVSRLDDVIAHAEKLADEHKVIEENGWSNVHEPPLASGKVPVFKANGDQKFIGDEISRKVNDLFCPSFFTREYIDKRLAF